jgi:hypothetical protein
MLSTGNNNPLLVQIGDGATTAPLDVQFFNHSVPTVPGVLSPSGLTTTLTPILSWNPSPTATGYIVTLTEGVDGQVVFTTNITGTSVISPPLKDKTLYVLTVDAYNAYGSSSVNYGASFPAIGAHFSTWAAGYTGDWDGTWSSDSGIGGTLTARLLQTGQSLTGTVFFYGSACLTQGTVTGTVDSQATANVTINANGGQTIFTRLSPNGVPGVDGTYTVHGGTCANGDSGGVFLQPRN